MAQGNQVALFALGGVVRCEPSAAAVAFLRQVQGNHPQAEAVAVLKLSFSEFRVIPGLRNDIQSLSHLRTPPNGAVFSRVNLSNNCAQLSFLTGDV